MDNAEFIPLDNFDPSKFPTLITHVPANHYFSSEDEQTAEEKRLVLMRDLCSAPIRDEFAAHLFQTNGDRMDALTARSFDHKVQDGVGCLVDALITNQVNPSEKFMAMFSNLQRIDTSSVEGFVYNVAIDDKNKVFLVKEQKDPVSTDLLSHEAFIGLCLNQLRSIIPNFMHTYGMLSCPIAPTIPGRQSICGITSTTSSNKLIVENIRRGRNLYRYTFANNSDYLNIIIQIVNALNIAYKTFGFTHYDLHAGNVMIDTFAAPFYIPIYMPDGSVKYLVTRNLVKIIDFGFSRISVNNTVFHRFDMQKYGITTEAYPMHDLHKILLTWYHNAKDHDRDAIALFERLYRFFNSNISTESLFKSYGKGNLLQPPNNRYKHLTHDMFMNYVFDNFADDITFMRDEIPREIYPAVCTNCYNWEQFTNAAFDTSLLPQTLIQYLDAMNAIDQMPDSDHKYHLRLFMSKVSLIDLYESDRPVIHQALINCIQRTSSLVFDESRLDVYIENMRLLVIIRDQLEHIHKWFLYAEVIIRDNYITGCLDSIATCQHNIKLLSDIVIRNNIKFAVHRAKIVQSDEYADLIDII